MAQPKKVNRRLLLKIKKHILAEPKRVWMSEWLLARRDEHHRERAAANGLRFPSCGTIGCIAGWAKQLGGRSVRGLPSEVAPKLLGLSDIQANLLFWTDLWPDEFESRLYRASAGTKAYAQVVADRIDHFLETGE